MRAGQRCVLVVTDLFVKLAVLLGRDAFLARGGGTRPAARAPPKKKLARTLDCQRLIIQRLLIDKNDSKL